MPVISSVVHKALSGTFYCNCAGETITHTVCGSGVCWVRRKNSLSHLLSLYCLAISLSVLIRFSFLFFFLSFFFYYLRFFYLLVALNSQSNEDNQVVRWSDFKYIKGFWHRKKQCTLHSPDGKDKEC